MDSVQRAISIFSGTASVDPDALNVVGVAAHTKLLATPEQWALAKMVAARLGLQSGCALMSYPATDALRARIHTDALMLSQSVYGTIAIDAQLRPKPGAPVAAPSMAPADATKKPSLTEEPMGYMNETVFGKTMAALSTLWSAASPQPAASPAAPGQQAPTALLAGPRQYGGLIPDVNIYGKNIASRNGLAVPLGDPTKAIISDLLEYNAKMAFRDVLRAARMPASEGGGWESVFGLMDGDARALFAEYVACCIGEANTRLSARMHDPSKIKIFADKKQELLSKHFAMLAEVEGRYVIDYSNFAQPPSPLPAHESDEQILRRIGYYDY